MKSRRTTQSSLTLLRDAIGPWRGVPPKIDRLGSILRGYLDGAELDRRLAILAREGVIEEIPTRAQLFAGAIDMLRFWISPAAADYYERQGIRYDFHQLLRFCDEPASLADPVGFFSERDGIIGHLMQVVHANPHYDLELLSMWTDGLAELEAQLEAMIAGTHPRARAIGAIVEEPAYHARLLDYVRAFRAHPDAPPPLRSNVADGLAFAALERTFGSLRAAMRYFCRLPRTWPGALRHLREAHDFPLSLAEPLPR
jgi:hypothetical protein